MEDPARAIADLGPTHAVIKLGPRGADARVDDGDYRRAAIPVSVVDFVGAGNRFVAGYVAE